MLFGRTGVTWSRPCWIAVLTGAQPSACAAWMRLEVGGDEDQGAHSGARGVGGHRAGEVSGGRAGERVEAVGAREVGRDRDITVLERPRRVEGVVLQIEVVEAQHLPEVARLHQGREARPQVDWLAIRGRQQLAIAPDRVGAPCNRLAADPLPDGGEVVGDLERPETVLADVGGFELPQSSALPTSQLLHRIPTRRLVTGNKKSPCGEGPVLPSVTASSFRLSSDGLSTLPVIR